MYLFRKRYYLIKSSSLSLCESKSIFSSICDTKESLTSLAMDVDTEAEKGDKISENVLYMAFNEIKLMIDGMKKNFEEPVQIGSIGGVMQSRTIRELLLREYNGIKIFYGYHVAIGNAMRLIGSRSSEVRDSLVSQMEGKIDLLSQTEKDLLFIK